MKVKVCGGCAGYLTHPRSNTRLKCGVTFKNYSPVLATFHIHREIEL